MEQLPAIAIGGPPHSGKSVLTYSLTQALRAQGVDHYVLRACPDGEGDWSNEAPPETVRLIRNKGQFTTSFVDNVCRALSRRHLPLLVDVGGRPTQEQERIFDDCTHAILLARDETGLATWRALAERHDLPIMAELTSTLTKSENVFAEYPILRGQIAGLERHQQVEGPVLERLAWNVKTLFAQKPGELRRLHLAQAPVELTVDLERLGRTLDIAEGRIWAPADVPRVLDYLPAAVPLALYGRGPNWLYAAIAVYAAPQPLYQFDARLGWVQPLSVTVRATHPAQPICWQLSQNTSGVLLDVRIVDTYLDYSEAQHLSAPLLPNGQGLILSGKLPHWLTNGLVLAYATATADTPWIAVYQPSLPGGPVVVASHDKAHPVGTQVSWLD